MIPVPVSPHRPDHASASPPAAHLALLFSCALWERLQGNQLLEPAQNELQPEAVEELATSSTTDGPEEMQLWAPVRLPSTAAAPTGPHTSRLPPVAPPEANTDPLKGLDPSPLASQGAAPCPGFTAESAADGAHSGSTARRLQPAAAYGTHPAPRGEELPAPASEGTGPVGLGVVASTDAISPARGGQKLDEGPRGSSQVRAPAQRTHPAPQELANLPLAVTSEPRKAQAGPSEPIGAPDTGQNARKPAQRVVGAAVARWVANSGGRADAEGSELQTWPVRKEVRASGLRVAVESVEIASPARPALQPAAAAEVSEEAARAPASDATPGPGTGTRQTEVTQTAARPYPRGGAEVEVPVQGQRPSWGGAQDRAGEDAAPSGVMPDPDPDHTARGVDRPRRQEERSSDGRGSFQLAANPRTPGEAPGGGDEAKRIATGRESAPPPDRPEQSLGPSRLRVEVQDTWGGVVRLDVRARSDAVWARVEGGPEVVHLLRAQADALHRALGEYGLTLAGLDVGSLPHWSGGTEPQPQFAPPGRPRAIRRPATPPPGGRAVDYVV